MSEPSVCASCGFPAHGSTCLRSTGLDLTHCLFLLDLVEKYAIRVALGNNGGEWATHYTDEHKEHWRKFIRDLIRELNQ